MTRLITGPMVLTAVLVLAACPAPDPADDPADDPVTANDEDPADRPVCLLGEPFVASGSLDVADLEPGDATRLGAIRWEDYEGCERLVMDLVTDDDAPADRPGAVTAEVLRDLGVVRISLRDVEWVDPDATDASFDGPLARGAYAVWAPEGRWVYVDVHLADAAEAHVSTLESPARVVIDLRPGGGAVPAPAPSENRVVVLEPRPGAASYPLTVTGYARTFEANVVVRLERDGQDVYDDFTTATAWVDAWGHYSFTIDDGPTGRVTLHVGEHSAKDGTWEGVAVELEMR
jgi:hypothetical protein